MIKKTISFTDYNGKERVEDAYFHLTKDEITSHLELEEEFEALQDLFGGDERELSRGEIQRVLNLVKKVLRLSYGIRSEDGSKFRQSPEIWDDFKSSAAHDALLWALFQEPAQAMALLNGVMPKDLVELAEAQARADAADRGPKRPQDRQQKQVAAKVPTVSDNEEVVFDDSQVEGSVDEPAEVPETDEESPEEKRARLQAELAALEG